jgi:hypothetical protein
MFPESIQFTSQITWIRTKQAVIHIYSAIIFGRLSRSTRRVSGKTLKGVRSIVSRT